VLHPSRACPGLRRLGRLDERSRGSQVLAKALQLHPTVAGLWSYAAAWELEHNRSPAAARALMQRGLRLCKADAQLWVEYFRLELLYAHTLRTRRKVLGVDAARGERTGAADRARSVCSFGIRTSGAPGASELRMPLCRCWQQQGARRAVVSGRA
jgi:U3 small nucleolar RNA-associated protein 6